MGIGHTSCYPGKRVRVFLKDGSFIDGKFVSKTDKRIKLDVGFIEIKLVRCLSILKSNPNTGSHKA
jgi:hypothetical protein